MQPKTLNMNKESPMSIKEKLDKANKPCNIYEQLKKQDRNTLLGEIAKKLDDQILGYSEAKKILLMALDNKLNDFKSFYTYIKILHHPGDDARRLINAFINILGIPNVLMIHQNDKPINGSRCHIGKLTKKLIELDCNNGILQCWSNGNNLIPIAASLELHTPLNIKYCGDYKYDVTKLWIIELISIISKDTLSDCGIDFSIKKNAELLYKSSKEIFINFTEINDKETFMILKNKIIPDLLTYLKLYDFVVADTLIQQIMHLIPNSVILIYKNILKDFLNLIHFETKINCSKHKFDIDINGKKILSEHEFNLFGRKTFIYHSKNTSSMYA